MDTQWLEKFDNKKVVILGYGMEGKSTYDVLTKYCPTCNIQVMDRNSDYVLDCFKETENRPFVYSRECYLLLDDDVDFVFKSPGIPLKDLEGHVDDALITSQSNEFIHAYRDRIIGITGTKGKSTTASFLNYLLGLYEVDAALVGNIGKPAFDTIESARNVAYYIYELSSHQLETVKTSPKYAVVLNIFEEHLDHYRSYEHYAEAKMNIARWQDHQDYFIYNGLTDEIESRAEGFKGKKLPITANEATQGIIDLVDRVDIRYEQSLELKDVDMGYLKGHHNLINMSVAVLLSRLVGYSNREIIYEGLGAFEGMPHRLAYVSTIDGVAYYNDSISTIPQATIAAIEAIESVSTIIVGGMDRGIDYRILIDYIQENKGYNWLMLPDTGHRISDSLGPMDNVVKVEDMTEAVKLAAQITNPGNACLLSPAAASYGFFKNFEERGHVYEQLIEAMGRNK